MVENAFGILANRWRIFRTEIAAKPEFVAMYVKACCLLHNFLIETNTTDSDEEDEDEEDGFREDPVDIDLIFALFSPLLYQAQLLVPQQQLGMEIS